MMDIHYDVTTGQIMSYGTGNNVQCCSNSHLPNCKILIRDYQSIDPKTEKIDLVLLEKVSKNEIDVEPEDLNVIITKIRFELTHSDKYMFSDYQEDKGMTQDQIDQWKNYRKSLRDASKGNGTIATIVAAIGTRPDGADAFKQFR